MFALVIAVFIGWKGSAEPIIKDEVLLPQQPREEQALQELYEANGPALTFSIDATHQASLWFSQQLNDGMTDLFVVFAKKQTVDEKGVPDSCHTCTVTVDAITYIRKPGGWAKLSAQKNVTELGSYGEAPKIVKANILSLSVGNVILAIPESYEGQGITNHGEALLNHFHEKWSDAGYIELAGDNAGTTCQKKDNLVPDADGECYSYSSIYHLRKGDSLTYPDIVVKRKGLEYAEESNSIEPVKDEIYVFNGKVYQSPRQQKRDQAEAARIAPVHGQSAAQNKVAPSPQPPVSPIQQSNQSNDELSRDLSATNAVVRIRAAVTQYANSRGETEAEFAHRINSTPEGIESFAYAFERRGGTVEGALKSLEGLSSALQNPQKVKLAECLGVKVCKDPQPPGHPPSASECALIKQQMGINN